MTKIDLLVFITIWCWVHSSFIRKCIFVISRYAFIFKLNCINNQKWRKLKLNWLKMHREKCGITHTKLCHTVWRIRNLADSRPLRVRNMENSAHFLDMKLEVKVMTTIDCNTMHAVKIEIKLSYFCERWLYCLHFSMLFIENQRIRIRHSSAITKTI